ncbi:MAG: PTS sugar transporter subunit IIC [candidate division KSB1 bacterium]|nr:PTS sugar transporter subunit IIC [candidate division KSB1 bacterium]
MELFPELLLICLIGGIVSIDIAAGWQVMVSQPIIACPVVGLVMGNLELGIVMGSLLELPWLIVIPTGGRHSSEANLGAVTATALSIYLMGEQVNTENIIIVVAIVYSLFISLLGNHLVNFMRQTNLRLMYAADIAASQADLSKITWLNTVGLIHAFLLGFLLVGFGVGIGWLILKPLVRFIHPTFDFAFGLARYAILGVGFGVVGTMFVTSETRWYAVLGMVLSTAGLIAIYAF